MTKISIKDLNNIYNMLYNMALGSAFNGLGARYKPPVLVNEEGELSYILEPQVEALLGYNLGVGFSLDNKKLHLVIYTDYEPKVYTKKDFKQPPLSQGVLNELYRFTQGYSFKNTKKYRGIIREFLAYYTNILELELRGDLVLANRFLKDFNNFNQNEGGWII
jgi:hypothetical protein